MSQFICSSCRQQLKLPGGFKGGNVKCPKCSVVLRVPGQTAATIPVNPASMPVPSTAVPPQAQPTAAVQKSDLLDTQGGPTRPRVEPTKKQAIAATAAPPRRWTQWTQPRRKSLVIAAAVAAALLVTASVVIFWPRSRAQVLADNAARTPEGGPLPATPEAGPQPPKGPNSLELNLGAGVTLKLVRIDPGKFMMGSPRSETGRRDDEQQHEVEITKPFYMGVFLVTQAQYERVTGKNPSMFSRTGKSKGKVVGLDTSQFPVEMVSWEDAMEFCRKLSQKEGKTIDLPTEAEWEYACRAGSTGPFHCGESLSSKQANFHGDHPYGGADKGPYLDTVTKVGSYEPNGFGLYDMHGNLFQWCKDWLKLDYYGESPQCDPQGPISGTILPNGFGVCRVLRGGGWSGAANECRSACRTSHRPDNRSSNVGFRVVLRNYTVLVPTQGTPKEKQETIALNTHAKQEETTKPQVSEQKVPAEKVPVNDLGKPKDNAKALPVTHKKADPKTMAELKAELQGLWLLEGSADGKAGSNGADPFFAIRGDELEWLIDEKERIESTIGLDLNRNIDFVIMDAKGKEVRLRGKYEIEKGKMLLNLNLPGKESGKSADTAVVLTKLEGVLPPRTGKPDEKPIDVKVLYENVKTKTAWAICTYHKRKVTVTGEVTHSAASRAAFKATWAGVTLFTSKDIVREEPNVLVFFRTTAKEPFSLRFIQYIQNLRDGDHATFVGICEIRRQADGRFSAKIENAGFPSP